MADPMFSCNSYQTGWRTLGRLYLPIYFHAVFPRPGFESRPRTFLKIDGIRIPAKACPGRFLAGRLRNDGKVPFPGFLRIHQNLIFIIFTVFSVIVSVVPVSVAGLLSDIHLGEHDSANRQIENFHLTHGRVY